MASLIEDKFKADKFERRRDAFFKGVRWRFMPFAQNDPLPDPRLLVPRQREEVLELLEKVKDGDLVSLIVSEIGMGKTALSRFFVETLPRQEDQRMVSVFLHGPSIETREQMLSSILENLELRVKEGDLAFQFDQLYRWHENYPDFLLVLVVDEFPSLDESVLEIVRSIADLRGTVWILNGREDQLIEFLKENSPSLLKRRRYTIRIQPMDFEETKELLMLRMAWARGDDLDVRTIEPFTSDGIERIQELSGGVPRESLKLAGDAVYNALEEDEVRITSELVYSREKGEKKRGFWSFLPFIGE